MQPKFLVVAHISRAQGLNGEFEIVSLTDYPERFAPGAELLLSPPLARISTLTIESVMKRPKGIVLKFQEFNSRDEIEPLMGRDLVVPVEDAVDLPEDEFWIHDLLGLTVSTIAGDELGTIAEVLRTGSNDVYVVRDSAGKESLIPAIKSVIKSISLEERKMTIDPIPGLLD
jgi:16S rRNA processing protein RimM